MLDIASPRLFAMPTLTPGAPHHDGSSGKTGNEYGDRQRYDLERFHATRMPQSAIHVTADTPHAETHSR